MNFISRGTPATHKFQETLYFIFFAHIDSNTLWSNTQMLNKNNLHWMIFYLFIFFTEWFLFFLITYRNILTQVMQCYKSQSHVWSLKAARIQYVPHLALFLIWIFDFWIVGRKFVQSFHGSTTEKTNTYSSAKYFQLICGEFWLSQQAVNYLTFTWQEVKWLPKCHEIPRSGKNRHQYSRNYLLVKFDYKFTKSLRT